MADPVPKLDLANLVEEHHQVLYRYAFRLTGAVPEAEDLTQQTFLVAQQKLAQVREAASVRGWLFAVLRNCYLKGFRKPSPLCATSLDLDVESIAAADVDQPLDREALQNAIGRLPEEFKLVVLMFYFEELSYREIAAQLSVPLGTVMSRLSRAKSVLRRLLEPAAAEAAPSGVPSRRENGSMAAEKTRAPEKIASPLAERSLAARRGDLPQ